MSNETEKSLPPGVVEAWGVRREDGGFVVDSAFRDAGHALEIAYGWPPQAEIDHRLANGAWAGRVLIVPAEGYQIRLLSAPAVTGDWVDADFCPDCCGSGFTQGGHACGFCDARMEGCHDCDGSGVVLKPHGGGYFCPTCNADGSRTAETPNKAFCFAPGGARDTETGNVSPDAKTPVESNPDAKQGHSPVSGWQAWGKVGKTGYLGPPGETAEEMLARWERVAYPSRTRGVSE